MLNASDIVTEVRRDLDETSASDSYWSDADLVAYINRVLRDVSNGLPVRTVHFTLTGDGSSQEFAISRYEQVADFHAVLDNQIPVPKISYARSLRESGIYATLPYFYGDYGFAPVQYAGRQKIRITPTIANGETRDVYAFALLGKVKETAYNTGTVSITNDSATVEGSGTAWATGSNAVAGECIEINGHYYVIESVTDADTLVLTEKVREATASGLSYTIGDATGLPFSAQEMLTEGVKMHSYRKEGDTLNFQLSKQIYDREYRTARAELEVLLTSDIQLGTTV